MDIDEEEQMSSKPDQDNHHKDDTLHSVQDSSQPAQTVAADSGVRAVVIGTPMALDKTLLFSEGRERQGRLTNSSVPKKRRGLFPADQFIKPAEQTLSSSPLHKTQEIASSTPVSDKPSSRSTSSITPVVMQLAREAFQRTMGFQAWLLSRTPPEKRADLENVMQAMPGPPRNLPSEKAIQRLIWLGQTIGYNDPVLWFIPPHISLEHLMDADILDPEWWTKDPNFPKGHMTYCPYEAEYLGTNQEPGYWILALPGIMPGTANRSYVEQSDMLENIARTAGLKTRDGHILRVEEMRVMVRGVAEVAVFFAMAQFVQAKLTDVPISVRTSTCHRGYQPGPDEAKSATFSSGPMFNLYDKSQVCVNLNPGQKLKVHDMDDETRGMTLGLAPFLVPFID